MAWLILTLKIFGILLLIILGLIILLLFVPAKLQVRWENGEKFAEGRFLFLKYRYSLDFFSKNATDASSGENASPAQSKEAPIKKESAQSMEPPPGIAGTPIEKSPAQPLVENILSSQELPSNEEGITLRRQLFKAWKAPRAPRPLRMLKTVKAPRLKASMACKFPAPKAFNPFKPLGSLTKLRERLYGYLEIYAEGKPLLYRVLKVIKIKKARFRMDYSIDSPDYNAQLMGLLWGIESGIHAILRRRFKKVRHHSFDLKSDFTGNHVKVGLDCVLTVRPVDLIAVALKSLKEIKALKTLIARQPKSAAA
ncbi:MAG: hypothetical protein FWF59_13625 [Turicibacter sp.]|nr:hypothetical protein [Turicibacter sp.]